MEYARDRITVNGVEPGFIRTAALEGLGEDIRDRIASHIPMGHLGDPQDIANAMLFLASDEAGYVTGQTLIVDGASTLPESPVTMELFVAGIDAPATPEIGEELSKADAKHSTRIEVSMV